MVRDIRLLRAALLANAAFSALTGLVLVAGHPTLAGWLGAVPPWVLAALGLGLWGFAAALVWIARTPTPLRALVVVALDLGWVLGTLPLAGVPGLFTAVGTAAVVAVALAVAGLAVAQLAGIRHMMRSPDPELGLWRHCVRVRAEAPADALWQVVADLGGISRFSPALVTSALEGGASPGEGAVRTCTNPAGQTWSEACEAFDPSRRTLTLRFLSDRPGFPYPASVMYGGWRVDPDGAGSIVEVWWTLTPTIGPGWLVVALMGARVDRDFAALIARMAEVANGRPVPDTPARLAAAFC